MIIKNEIEINGCNIFYFIDVENDEEKYFGKVYAKATEEITVEKLKEALKAWFRIYKMPKDFSVEFKKAEYEEIEEEIYMTIRFKISNVQK